MHALNTVFLKNENLNQKYDQHQHLSFLIFLLVWHNVSDHAALKHEMVHSEPWFVKHDNPHPQNV